MSDAHREHVNDLPGLAAHCANPILPGYYADPSIVQHDGKNYIYVTLDPWGSDTLGCWARRLHAPGSGLYSLSPAQHAL
ncbi:MAG TPA: hypothetical protein VF600_03350 [Abditibacteriaceae bacterium]|jgi:hypothetical protein